MNQFELLKKLLPGLLPLLVFILVDELYGTSAGLIVAVAFGVAQLLYTYIKNKVLDKFTLFDTLLIVILGSISYALENDIFFKIKPALVGAILCILLGVSAFSKVNIVALMSKRYFDGITLSDEQIKQFNRSLKILFFIFVAHTLLVLYSAFYMSIEAWAFISTVLFYLLAGVYFLFELIRKKIKNRKFRGGEWLPLVDEDGKVIGQALRSDVHQKKDLMHPVVHLHILNSLNQIYLQKRSLTKDVEPGKWDTAVAGHVGLSETVDGALLRETEEETGAKNVQPVAVSRYVLRTERETELVFIFFARYEGGITINKSEADEGKFWKLSEIIPQLGSGCFTPSFEIEFSIMKKKRII